MATPLASSIAGAQPVSLEPDPAGTPAENIAQISEIATASLAVPVPVAVVVASPDATKSCPMCAETIKAAAKLCRFCGAILDETLRQQEEQRGPAKVARDVLALTERSANLWRAAGMLFTSWTASWLVFLTASAFSSMPFQLIAFNVLLIFGLLWSARQMKKGPYQVFLAAAITILACMPLNCLLAFMLEILPMDEVLRGMKERDPLHSAFFTTEFLFWSWFLMFFGAGCLFSLPVWIATFKVLSLERLRRGLRRKQ